MSKYTVGPIIKDHIHTLVDARTGKHRKRDYVLPFGIPVVVAVTMFAFDVHLRSQAEIIAGVAILSGLLIALVIFVFQLRLQVAQDPRMLKGSLVTTLLDQLFANVNYAAVIGLLTTVVTVVAAVMAGGASLGRFMSAAVAGLGLHLILTIGMCMKRIRAAYRELTI